MPLVRYEIRCEHSLANPELYRSAARDDPEGLLEGVAMAGLVGIVRQLGDLAEFASEIFRDIHEELITLGGRGHDLTVRVRQLEVELPTVEKALLSEPNQLRFAYTNGADWHASIRSDQNHCTSGDLPRFVRNFYEECRGPPRLFLLDKFDVAGAGACLKRYTDPSFFKVEWASSELMKAQRAQRDKKARREKKKNRRRKTGQAIAAINQIPARVRYGSASLEDLDGLPQLVASTLKDDVSSLPNMDANQGAGTQVHISSALSRKVNGAEDPSIPSLKTSRRVALQNEGLSQAPSPLKLSAKEIESANMTGKFYRHKELDGMAKRISKIIDMEDHNTVPSTGPIPRSMDKGSIAANGSKPPAPSNVDIPVKPKIIHRVSREDLEAAAMARTGRTSRGTSRGNSSMDLRDGVNQPAGVPKGSIPAFIEPKMMPVKASRKSMEVIGTVQPSGKVPRRTSLDMKEALSRGVKYPEQNSMGGFDVDVADELVRPHSVMSSGVNLNSEVQVGPVVPGARLRNVDTEVNTSLTEHVEAKIHSSSSQSLEQSYSQRGIGNPSQIAQTVGNRADEHQITEELREAHSLEHTVPAVGFSGEGRMSSSSDRHNSHDSQRHVFVQVSEAWTVEEPQVESGGGVSDSPTCSSPHLPPVQIVEVFEDGEEELPMPSSGGFSPIASSPGHLSNASSPAIEQESVQPSMSILSRRPGEMMSSSSNSAPDSPNVSNSHIFDPLYSPPGPRDMIDSPPGNYMGSYSPSAIPVLSLLTSEQSAVVDSTPFVEDYGEPGLSNFSSNVDLGAPSSAVNPYPEVATHPVGLSEVGLSSSSVWSTTPAPALTENRRSVEPGGETVKPGGEPVEPGGEPVEPGGEPVEPGGEPVELDGEPGLSISSSNVDLEVPSSAVNSHPEVAMHPVGPSEVEHSSSPLWSTTPAPGFTKKLRSSLVLPPRPADSPGSSAPSSPMGSSRQSFQRICVSNPSVQLAPSPLGHSVEDTSVIAFGRDEDSAPSSPSGSVIIKDTPSPPGSPTSNYSESESEGLDFYASSNHPENLGSLGLVMLTVEDEGFPEQEGSGEVAVSENKTANLTHLASTSSESIKQNVILNSVLYTRSGQPEMFVECLPASASEIPMSNAVSDYEVIEEDPLLLQGLSRSLQVKYDSASSFQIADTTILRPIVTGRRNSRSQNSLASNSPPDSPPREEESGREDEKSKSNGLCQGGTSAQSPPKPQSRHPQLTSPLVRSSSNSPPYSPTKSVLSEEASSLRWCGRSNHVSPPKPNFSLPPNLVCRSVSNSPPCSPPPPSDSESPRKWMVRSESSDDIDGSSASSDSPPTSPQKGAPDVGVGVYRLPDSPLPPDSSTMSIEEGDFSPGEPSRSNNEDEYCDVAEHHAPELEPVAKTAAGQQLPREGSDEEVLDKPPPCPRPNKFIPIVVTHSDIGHLPSKKSVTESQLYTSGVIESPPVEEGQQSLSVSGANMSTTAEQTNKPLAAGFDIRKTLSTHDALAAAIVQHDRNMLKVLTHGSQESMHRTLPASLDRCALLEQIRTKSFNLRRTDSMEKNEPALRPAANINVAAILEKANAIRQAFVGSDDEDDAEDDWSDS